MSTINERRLRDALLALRPFVDGLNDEGPSGEGWQSDELKAAIETADAALAATEGAAPAAPPPVELPDERQRFEAWILSPDGYGGDISAIFEIYNVNVMWSGWQARAALSAAQPAQEGRE